VNPSVPAKGDIVLTVAPGAAAQAQLLGAKAQTIHQDGYMIVFRDGGALIYGMREHAPRLFRYDPAQRFSCYNVPLGQLRIKPSLSSPLPLMKELYDKSKQLIEGIVGPDYLPAEWKRGAK